MLPVPDPPVAVDVEDDVELMLTVTEDPDINK